MARSRPAPGSCRGGPARSLRLSVAAGGAGAGAAPGLFQGGRRRSTPGPARRLHPRSPASLGSSSGMAEPGRLCPAAESEGAADEFRDVIRSRSGRHRIVPRSSCCSCSSSRGGRGSLRGPSDPALGNSLCQHLAKLLFALSELFPLAVRRGRKGLSRRADRGAPCPCPNT